MTDRAAIKVDGVTKSFKIPLDKNPNLKQNILSGFRKSGYRKFTPLNEVSFEVEKGDFFGIVGRNGSGKSTLLKTIAGIYTPDEGSVSIDGLLVPFIELGVGFNPELSGRENVYLNGALLGFDRSEIESMYDDIVDFAELHDFMEEKLRNYSSGMQVRLAFSIAIRARGDILLLDEVLAVGDSAFQQKCYDYFQELKENKKTVILVSHSMSAVQRFCNKALLLEKGEIKFIGSSEDAASHYEDMFIRERSSKVDADIKAKQQEEKDIITIDDIYIMQNGSKTDVARAFENFQLYVKLRSDKTIKRANVGFNIKNADGNVLAAFSLKYDIGEITLKKNEAQAFEIDIENILTNGTYTVNMAIAESDDGAEALVSKKRDVLSFGVSGVQRYQESLVHPKVTIKRV